jgi:hypothetical protein
MTLRHGPVEYKGDQMDSNMDRVKKNPKSGEGRKSFTRKRWGHNTQEAEPQEGKGTVTTSWEQERLYPSTNRDVYYLIL